MRSLHAYSVQCYHNFAAFFATISRVKLLQFFFFIFCRDFLQGLSTATQNHSKKASMTMMS